MNIEYNKKSPLSKLILLMCQQTVTFLLNPMPFSYSISTVSFCLSTDLIDEVKTMTLNL